MASSTAPRSSAAAPVTPEAQQGGEAVGELLNSSRLMTSRRSALLQAGSRSGSVSPRAPNPLMIAEAHICIERECFWRDAVLMAVIGESLWLREATEARGSMRLVVTYGLERSNVLLMGIAVPAGDEVRDSLHTHEVVITVMRRRSLTVALLGQLYQLFLSFPTTRRWSPARCNPSVSAVGSEPNGYPFILMHILRNASLCNECHALLIAMMNADRRLPIAPPVSRELRQIRLRYP